ncbi:type IV secretion-system coupling protein DNA-binding domain protein [Halalkalicoccus paucihalophilus]|uniref:Type IV secretion-system coupling protein DNA-binding domain protein n=1 Tax=Halalkalicoccus paucihalophilus TaxID=1008153 RepID=A0A151A7V1_9EURY|nr:type IV secretion system DNA-binding domain-containing protein [Halalkalicoccus paucihalophilus]KYH23776.1 type IV secretion-system coupling protein DNA-binding domain protein [Halalkalicoccus paucihalophilus]
MNVAAQAGGDDNGRRTPPAGSRCRNGRIINPETERQAGSVFATAQQQVTDLFVGDFAESGEFSIREYMQNPDGRVLVLDYPIRQSGTIAPVFRYLIDQAIMHGMDDPDRSAYYLLDEIEHLDTTIKRLGELINVGRGVNCQAILSLQSVAQLEDTYGKERAHALLSGMVTVIGLRTADEESVDFLRETVGTSFEQYTQNSGDDHTLSESEEKEEYQFAKGDLRNFDPGETVICRQGSGWVHGQIQLLEDRASFFALCNDRSCTERFESFIEQSAIFTQRLVGTL